VTRLWPAWRETAVPLAAPTFASAAQFECCTGEADTERDRDVIRRWHAIGHDLQGDRLRYQEVDAIIAEAKAAGATIPRLGPENSGVDTRVCSSTRMASPERSRRIPLGACTTTGISLEVVPPTHAQVVVAKTSYAILCTGDIRNPLDT
jgi:hypothetical protein